MPKYCGKQIFANGRFPEVGQKQKTERKRRREKEEERLNDGNNNGQATHGARKHAWRTHAACIAHASRLGQCKIISKQYVDFRTPISKSMGSVMISNFLEC